MDNLDIFDATCAKLLAELYSKFPLEIEEFRSESLGLYDRNSISEEESIARQIVSESIVFLKENGYISYNGWEGYDTGEPKYHMKLTAKGLEKLRRIPDGLVAEEEDLGSALLKRAGKIGNLSVDEIVRNLVKAFFGGPIAN